MPVPLVLGIAIMASATVSPPATHPTTLPGLVAFWDFHEPAGQPKVAQGPHVHRLVERGGTVPRVDEGVFGPHAAAFGKGPWLEVARADGQALNLHGPDAKVTVVAWIKRSPHPLGLQGACQAVAGMWNEHGKRQYCLFLNLRIHDSAEQVGAHMSAIGGPTPGYRYCMDAAIGATPVPFDQWQTVAVTYDSEWARAYLNGRLDTRGDRNPYRYPGGLFDGGPDGADFTVGAVARPERVDPDGTGHGHAQANLFQGLLGGLAVYDRALSAEEIAALALTGA
jgi:hypothetical protein